MGKYFGTDGFRGEANIDLTVEHAYKSGKIPRMVFRKRPQSTDRHWKRHQTLQLHVRIFAGSRTDRIGSRRLSAARNDHPERFLMLSVLKTLTAEL